MKTITNKDKIILASASPRRIEMMHRHGFDPVIMPADIDETLPENIGMEEAVKYLAMKKGSFIEEKIIREMPEYLGYTILAADTVVYKDGIMGKPADRSEAFEMLQKIKNTDHFVTTGVAIIVAGKNKHTVFADSTRVFCKDYTDEQLNDYLDTDEPYDKAGAYAIQGLFSKYIAGYEGSFDTVVGFPWDLIVENLKSM